MKKKLAVFLLIVLFMNVFSCRSKQSLSNKTDFYPYTETVEVTRAEQVIRALRQAYPDRIDIIEYRNDDWAFHMRGTWFYFAGGRILPEHRIEHSANYRSLQFYNYPEELPPWTPPPPEETARFNSWTNNRSQNTIARSSYFLDALWQAHSRAEIESHLVRITFLGRNARVHRLIHDNLKQVEAQIRAAARTNPPVQVWIDSIGTMESWGWRNIADTQARSYHSYGIAIDILPRNLGGRQTYWLWTSQYRRDWWNVSYNERYHPPAVVIKIFEASGFVWGGKWPLFDTMHFEYRPEILILNGLL